MKQIKQNVNNRANVISYTGGKSTIAPWIVNQFPEHSKYVEPFCGSLAVFFHKPPCHFEVINDLDREVVNFFQCIRDHVDELTMQLLFTPVSREEFIIALQDADNLSLVERARAFFIRQNQGFAGSASSQGCWTIRDLSSRNLPIGIADWQTKIALLSGASQRLRNTIIENRDALEVIQKIERMNNPDQMLVYCDPPYVASTRKTTNIYTYEMADTQHENLLQVAVKSQAMWAISGYDSEMYHDYLRNWICRKKNVVLHASGHIKGVKSDRRTECLWLNPLAMQTQQQQLWT